MFWKKLHNSVFRLSAEPYQNISVSPESKFKFQSIPNWIFNFCPIFGPHNPRPKYRNTEILVRFDFIQIEWTPLVMEEVAKVVLEEIEVMKESAVDKDGCGGDGCCRNGWDEEGGWAMVSARLKNNGLVEEEERWE